MTTTPSFGDILQSDNDLGLCVVLVEPKDPRNIGAVARAMSNLNVGDLRLVNPSHFDLKLAKSVACWGEDVIEQSKSFDSLNAAVSDTHEVVGFASDSGHHRLSQLLLEDWIKTIDYAPKRKIALVFGSEEQGLRREHFPLCQNLVRIPSAGSNRSYNLAQSVLLALYALQRRSSAAVGDNSPDLPTSGQLENFTEMVLRSAKEVGFLNENSPQHISDVLINLTRRGRLSTRELKIMTGLFGMIYKRITAK